MKTGSKKDGDLDRKRDGQQDGQKSAETDRKKDKKNEELGHDKRREEVFEPETWADFETRVKYCFVDFVTFPLSTTTTSDK